MTIASTTATSRDSVIVDRYVTALTQVMDDRALNEHGLYRLGKFESQTPLCATLYEYTTDRRAVWQAGAITKNGTAMAGFRLTAAEAAELGVRPYVIITEASQGFVTMDEYDDLAVYEAVLHPADDPDFDIDDPDDDLPDQQAAMDDFLTV